MAHWQLGKKEVGCSEESWIIPLPMRWPMAFQGRMKLVGTNQGTFKGGSAGLGSLGGVVTPRRTTGGVVFVRPVDKASPILFQGNTGGGTTNGQCNGYSEVLRLGPCLTALQGIATGRVRSAQHRKNIGNLIRFQKKSA
jgi:hypothetical protein